MPSVMEGVQTSNAPRGNAVGLEDVTFACAVLASSITLTVLVVMLARAIRRLHFSWCAVLTILVGTGDVCTDVLFMRMAWRQMQLAAIECEPSAVECAEGDDVATVRLVAFFATIAVIAPLVLAIALVLIIVVGFQRQMDGAVLQRHPVLFGSVLVLSVANPELLRLLPWHERRFDGLPSVCVLGLTFVTSVCEDVPQVALQVFVVVSRRFTNSGSTYAPTVSFLTLTFSVVSLWVRGFRKVLVALFPTPVRCHQAGSGRPTLRGPRAPKMRSSRHPFFTFGATPASATSSAIDVQSHAQSPSTQSASADWEVTDSNDPMASSAIVQYDVPWVEQASERANAIIPPRAVSGAPLPLRVMPHLMVVQTTRGSSSPVATATSNQDRRALTSGGSNSSCGAGGSASGEEEKSDRDSLMWIV